MVASNPAPQSSPFGPFGPFGSQSPTLSQDAPGNSASRFGAPPPPRLAASSSSFGSFSNAASGSTSSPGTGSLGSPTPAEDARPLPTFGAFGAPNPSNQPSASASGGTIYIPVGFGSLEGNGSSSSSVSNSNASTPSPFSINNARPGQASPFTSAHATYTEERTVFLGRPLTKPIFGESSFGKSSLSPGTGSPRTTGGFSAFAQDGPVSFSTAVAATASSSSTLTPIPKPDPATPILGRTSWVSALESRLDKMNGTLGSGDGDFSDAASDRSSDSISTVRQTPSSFSQLRISSPPPIPTVSTASTMLGTTPSLDGALPKSPSEIQKEEAIEGSTGNDGNGDRLDVGPIAPPVGLEIKTEQANQPEGKGKGKARAVEVEPAASTSWSSINSEDLGEYEVIEQRNAVESDVAVSVSFNDLSEKEAQVKELEKESKSLDEEIMAVRVIVANAKIAKLTAANAAKKALLDELRRSID